MVEEDEEENEDEDENEDENEDKDNGKHPWMIGRRERVNTLANDADTLVEDQPTVRPE